MRVCVLVYVGVCGVVWLGHSKGILRHIHTFKRILFYTHCTDQREDR